MITYLYNVRLYGCIGNSLRCRNIDCINGELERFYVRALVPGKYLSSQIKLNYTEN